MPTAATNNPNRTPVFRLITIAAAGLGSFILGIWGLKLAFGENLGTLSAEVFVPTIAALCALAAAGGVISFFAGIDESSDYVFSETQIDKLTGFHSRAAMIGKIAEAAIQTSRTGEPVFLVDIDIDRFKSINDAIGYEQGDFLIRSFAQRLAAIVPPNSPIGRIGAGELCILIEADAINIPIEKLCDILIAEAAKPYDMENHSQSLNISAGLVAMPKDGTDPIALLHHSNLALQQARASGGGTWSIFHSDMGKVAEYRRWIEAELHSAFQNGDFDLHYQPQFDMSSNEAVGYEALIRWRHSERGMIPPSEFIPVAEETGMIKQIGNWVLRRACADALELPDNCFVAVNISPVQFIMNDFAATVRAALDETGLPASRLELEITETAMMQDKQKAASILRQIHEMGISIAVDDFGTGYSNLSYLIDFDFNKLKIDRSFVSRIDRDTSTGAVVSTIVGLSRALGVNTIAEGVETEDQATLLRAAGCDVVQGYFFGKPAPLVLSDVVEHERKAASIH